MTARLWRQQFAVVAPKPPSPGSSGALPTVLGISPAIGPPFAAAAGVESVQFAPVIVLFTSHDRPSSGVMPWTCAEPLVGNTRPAAIVRATKKRRRIDCLLQFVVGRRWALRAAARNGSGRPDAWRQPVRRR